MSERELMVRGTIGHNERSIEAIVGRIIGKDIPIYVRMASAGTLAFITFRNEKEATDAIAKIAFIENPIKEGVKWMTCIRARYKEKHHDNQKEWDDVLNRWATPTEMSEKSTRDKGKAGEGGGSTTTTSAQPTQPTSKKKKRRHQSAQQEKYRKNRRHQHIGYRRGKTPTHQTKHTGA